MGLKNVSCLNKPNQVFFHLDPLYIFVSFISVKTK